MKHCKKNDLQVEADAPVAEVVKIVLNAFGDGSVAAEAVDLGPSGDSGFDIVAGIVGLKFFGKFAHEEWAFRTWADHTHVAFEHV